MDVDKVTQAVGKINHGAARCHLDMTPGLQRCEKEKEVAGAVAFILVVIFGHFAVAGADGSLWSTVYWLHQDRPQVAWDPVADDRPQGIFHGTNELCTRCLRNAPRIFQPGLKFSVVRTVSREIRSTTSNSTSLSASICSVHCPSGAALHANCTNRASPAPSNTRGRFRFGRVWVRAASSPIVTHRSRTRSTVRWCAPNALAISASHQPPPACASSAISRMRARLKRDPVPGSPADSSLRFPLSIAPDTRLVSDGECATVHLSGKPCSTLLGPIRAKDLRICFYFSRARPKLNAGFPGIRT